MNRRRRYLIAGAAVLLCGVTFWLGAQALAPGAPPLARLMPQGALFYLEARNLESVAKAWNESPEKKAWSESPSSEVFLRSTLALRLAEMRKNYLEAAGIPEDAPIVEGIAGGESAIAFYNISKFEFLYISQVNLSAFSSSALGKVRQKFEARKVSGRDYYFQTKGENTIAFALVDDRLFLSTREDLLAEALKRSAGEKLDSLSEEGWFVAALAKAPAGRPEVRLVADMQRTTATHAFRSYWIQQNVTEMKQFALEVADLSWSGSEIREDRVLIRKEAQDSLAPTEPAVADLLRFAALPDAGFYQAVAQPAAADVKALVMAKVFGKATAGRGDRGRAGRNAPQAPGGAEIDSEYDLEARIDQKTEVEAFEDPYSPLAGLAANTDAMFQAGGSRLEADKVLVSTPSVVVLHGAKAWNVEEVKRTLGQVAGAVWAQAPGALVWSAADRNGITELNSASPLAMAIDGRALVISASPDWMRRVWTARRSSPDSSRAPATYVAQYRHAQEVGAFERLMRLLDNPQLPQTAAGDSQPAGDAREPQFFSENLVSLAKAMMRLDAATVTSRDSGDRVTERVVYRASSASR